ncbi:MAG: haloacid dehalogenase [Clostridia bacterium]|nr:haloacid dehalogenase [Clostridia bacterium]
MSDILFACDLDNTLIHSYKHKKDGDICVEWIDGKEQGYMSKEVLALLRRIKDLVDIVPVTTRSVSQYLRISWPYSCKPKCAITTHGAKLLINEEIDRAWDADSGLLTSKAESALENIVSGLEKTNLFLRCRMVDQSYAFVYNKFEKISAEAADQYPIPDSLYRIRSGKKTYFIPKGIDKGNAVMRYMKDKAYKTLFCAGDSKMDLAMLDAADIAFAPQSLGAALTAENEKRLYNDASFPEDMLGDIAGIICAET